MTKFVCLFWAVLLGYVSNAQYNTYSLKTSSSIALNAMQNGFVHPPTESKLRCYWWWLNSMATRESITRDLEEMQKKGYGGASLVDAGSSNYNEALKTAAGPVFMSPGWMELYKHAVKEATRLGIELSVNVQSGWNPGGPFITPENALKKITISEVEVSGGKTINISLPQPAFKLIYKDILIQAIPKPATKGPLKDAAIANWSFKTFTKSMGGQGIYPLYMYREGFDTTTDATIVKQNEIQDLTRFYDGNTLTWKAPAGEWTIIRYGWTNTGVVTSTTSDGWNGLSLDHMNPDGFEMLNQHVIQPLIKTAKEAGNSVRFLQTDSWEMGVINWTQKFPEAFKQFRGYNIEKFLPVLTGRVVESQDISNRFLYDFRKTVSDCILKNHYSLFSGVAHKNGMGIHPESGGPHSAPIDALQVMGINDFPQGEFWAMSNTHRVSDAARLAVKQSACVAHTNGKKFVAAEGPASIGPQWERSPRELKSNIDRVFCSGVNRIVWHTFTSSPKEYGLPGNEYFAGTHMNPNVTWWSRAGTFVNYLNRCSYMLQQGLFVADVLYYYGDDVPNFVFLKDEFTQLNFGYDWDKCSRDVVLNRLATRDGKIVLPDGMQYRLLVLPPDRAISLDVLKKIEILVKEGITVYAPRPQEATGLTNYPNSDQELKAIVNRLWGKVDGSNITENKYGKGKIIWGKDINEVLASMKVAPDFTFKGTHPQASYDYMHRTTDNADIYFLSNRFEYKQYNDFKYRYNASAPDRYEQIEASFRITGSVPQVWDAMTGLVTNIITYREENGRTIIPLHFEPGGSKFIVFKKNSSPGSHITSVQHNGKTIFPGVDEPVQLYPSIFLYGKDTRTFATIYEPGLYSLTWSDGKITNLKSEEDREALELKKLWRLQFDPQWGSATPLQIDELKSWTSFDDPKIKYYSGKAYYTSDFNMPSKSLENKKLVLELGNVQDMATITINGKEVATKWTFPYSTDISGYLIPGKNTIGVEVVNLWANRLIGDSKLPKEQRITQTNVIKFNKPGADSLLRVSGLLGPVKILVVPDIEVK